MPDTPQTEAQNQETHLIAPENAAGDESNPSDGQAAPAEKDLRTCGAFKCYFLSPKRGDIRGAFCLLFDGMNGRLVENVFWVTFDATRESLDVGMPWRDFSKAIPDMGPYEKSMGEKMRPLLLEIFPSFVRTEIFHDDEGTLSMTRPLEELRRNYERMTHYFLEFKTALERFPRQELVDAGILSDEESEKKQGDSPQSDEEYKSFAGTLITCLPVIDPVRGTPVSELQPGDLIEVRIQGGVGAGGLIQQYLTSTSQDAVFPVETVEKKADDRTYVFLTINDEIRGLLSLTKDLRLRTLRRKARKKSTITLNMDNVIFFGTLAVAVVVILLVIRFLFFSV